MIKVNNINPKIFQMTLPNGYQIIYDHNTHLFGVQNSEGKVVESYFIHSKVSGNTICANFETLKLQYSDAI